MLTIKEIKKIRKQLGLTQHELANQAGVSQSLIAKIESNRIDPTYTKAHQILDVLSRALTKKSQSAQDVMIQKVFSVKPSDTFVIVTRKMKQHGISQLPVIDEGKAVGMISESVLLDALSSDPASIHRLQVGEIMEQAPPVVDKETPIQAVISLLKFFPMVLVAQAGKIKGVITKADVIEQLV